VKYKSAAGKCIVPAESAFRVAGKPDARRGKARLAAHKIAQLDAEAKMRERSFDVRTSS
jgi:hypothetical protein